MHHVLYKEHYYGNMTGEEEMLLRIHSGRFFSFFSSGEEVNTG